MVCPLITLPTSIFTTKYMKTKICCVYELTPETDTKGNIRLSLKHKIRRRFFSVNLGFIGLVMALASSHSVWALPAHLYLVEGTNGLTLNSAAITLSNRFTAKASGLITQYGIYISGFSPPSPAYVVALQADSGGNPSGVDIPGSPVTFGPSAVGWANFPGVNFSL